VTTTIVTAAQGVGRRGQTPAGRTDCEVQLNVLGSFEVRSGGDPVQFPVSAQRVLAFLVLRGRSLRRDTLAGSLWLDATDQRAAASLRSALWRINRRVRLVEVDGEQLRLDRAVRVDLREAELIARRELDFGPVDSSDDDAAALSSDLLPDWYEDWVILEREHFRQLRLRALDARCERLARTGRLSEALDAGLLSVAGEPLRESAHRALVQVHIAYGNLGEAARQYRLCRQLFREQLGIEPSEQLREMIVHLDVPTTDL
jgi:DNA-binding SARP family transcriptional activator